MCKEDTFIGKTFTTPKGGVLTVLYNNGLTRGDKKYICSCSICSKDKELWPDGSILATKDNLKTGRIPCGCSSCVRRKDWQYKVLVRRFLEERGYTLLDNNFYNSENLQMSSRVTLYNPSTGVKWSPKLSDMLLRKLHDSVEGRVMCEESRAIPDETHISDFIKAGFPPNTRFWRSNKEDYRGDKAYWWYTCGECGGTHETLMSSLKRGYRGCSCRTHGYKTSKQGTFYVVEWYGFAESYLKYGITNSEVVDRIKVQSRKTSLDYEIIHTFQSEDGQIALDVENELKAIYGRKGVCPKKWLPDGYTETVENTDENLETILQIVNKHFKQ